MEEAVLEQLKLMTAQIEALASQVANIAAQQTEMVALSRSQGELVGNLEQSVGLIFSNMGGPT